MVSTASFKPFWKSFNRKRWLIIEVASFNLPYTNISKTSFCSIGVDEYVPKIKVSWYMRFGSSWTLVLSGTCANMLIFPPILTISNASWTAALFPAFTITISESLNLSIFSSSIISVSSAANFLANWSRECTTSYMRILVTPIVFKSQVRIWPCFFKSLFRI